MDAFMAEKQQVAVLFVCDLTNQFLFVAWNYKLVFVFNTHLSANDDRGFNSDMSVFSL